MIRVALVDDQDLVRGGLRAILDAEDDIEVVGEASDGAGAVRLATARLADVVLMDVQMPVVDGIEGTRRVIEARPECRVLVLTMFDLDEYVFAGLRAGASGFLLKTTPPDELASAVRACHSGELLFAPTVTRRLVETYVRHPPATTGVPPGLEELTAREVEVLRAIARGALERRDRGRALPRRGDGEDPCDADPGQARAARPRPGRRPRLRDRPRAEGVGPGGSLMRGRPRRRETSRTLPSPSSPEP